MEQSRNYPTPHPQQLDLLFAFKNKVSNVFREVLGLYEINHISLARINKKQELLSFSSTPAMEFNLFSSPLWHYDHTYNPEWFRLCSHSDWQRLYTTTRYDELYYLKQIKHSFPLGLSFAAQINEEHVVYSVASHKDNLQTRELFTANMKELYQIGQYCSNMLAPLFAYCDQLS